MFRDLGGGGGGGPHRDDAAFQTLSFSICEMVKRTLSGPCYVALQVRWATIEKACSQPPNGVVFITL